MRKKLALSLAIVLSISLGLSGCSKSTDTALAEGATSSEVVEEKTVDATGTILTENNKTVSLDTAIKIKEILVHEGDPIPKDGRIFRVDLEDLHYQISQKEKDLQIELLNVLNKDEMSKKEAQNTIQQTNQSILANTQRIMDLRNDLTEFEVDKLKDSQREPSEISQLKSQIAQAKIELTQLQLQESSGQYKADYLNSYQKNNLTQEAMSLKDAETSLQQAKISVYAKKQQIEFLEKELTRLEEDRKESYEKNSPEIKQLQKQISDLELEVTKLKLQKENTENKKESLEDSYDDNEKISYEKLEKLRLELNNLNKQLSDAITAGKQSDIDALNYQITQKEKDISIAEIEYNSQKELNDTEIKNSLKQIDETLTATTKRIEELKKDLKEAEEQRSKDQTREPVEIAQTKNQITQAKNELNQLNLQEKVAQDKVNLLKYSQNNSLTQQDFNIKDATTSIEQIKNNILSKQQQIEFLEKDLKLLEDKRKESFEKASPDMKQTKRQISDLQHEVTKLQIQKKGAQNNLSSLDESLVANKKINSEKIEKLKLELDKIKKILTDGTLDGEYLVVKNTTGVISELSVKEGDAVTANQKLCTLTGVQELFVRANVDEAFIKDVKIGQQVTITPLADKSKEYRGKVTSIASMAILKNGETVIPVDVSIDNRDDLLKANFNVDIIIKTNQK